MGAARQAHRDTEYGGGTQPGLYSMTSEPYRVFDRIDAVVCGEPASPGTETADTARRSAVRSRWRPLQPPVGEPMATLPPGPFRRAEPVYGGSPFAPRHRQADD
jgi:hypothetical protein